MQNRQKTLAVVSSTLVIIGSLVLGWKNYMNRNHLIQENTVTEIRKSSPWASSSNNFILTVLDNGDVLLFEPEVGSNNNQQINKKIIGHLKKTDMESLVSMFTDLDELKTQPIAFDREYIQMTFVINGQQMTLAYITEDPNIPDWLRSPEKIIYSTMTLP